MDERGWPLAPPYPYQPPENDVDVLMQIIADEDAVRYEPYTPPHSDDACSPQSTTTSFNGRSNSSVFHSDTDPSMNHSSEYGELWNPSKKRRRHSPTNDYTTVFSIDNVAFQQMEQLDPSDIEAELGFLPLTQIKEEAPSPPSCQSALPHREVEESQLKLPSREEKGDDSSQLKWMQYELDNACSLCNERQQPLSSPKLHVSADKGFSYSSPDDSFVNHRKNHFQISLSLRCPSRAGWVGAPGGHVPLTGFEVHIHGMKVDSLNQKVMVEQSQTDRRKRPYQPIHITPEEGSGSISTTISRLHFSETTQNNHRKRGLPNPEQKYFKLAVELYAISNDQRFPLVGGISERFIVRASNPKQFESESSDPVWQQGTHPSSMYYKGRVGINTRSPEESLTVQGNIKVTGQVLQPCDARVKDKISEVNYGDQLKTVSGIRLHKYHYKDSYTNTVELAPQQQTEIGVIAQEVRELLPDAVVDVGDLQLNNGDRIPNLLVVNKDRIFLESVGAVKELCKLHGNMENRLCDLERRDRKFTKFAKRFGESFSSTSSSRSSMSSKSSKASGNCGISVMKPEPPLPIPTVDQGTCCGAFHLKQQAERRNRRTIIGLLTMVFVLGLICVAAITAAVLYSEKTRAAKEQAKVETDVVYVQGGGSNTGDASTPGTTQPPLTNDTRSVLGEAIPPLETVETYVNCSMQACREQQCCGKVAEPPPTEQATTPAPKDDVTTTMASKVSAKSVAQSSAASADASQQTSSTQDAAASIPNSKEKPTGIMQADGAAMVVKTASKMRRKRAASGGVMISIMEDCTIDTFTAKSIDYLCPTPVDMANNQAVTITMQTDCKLAAVTCDCSCQATVRSHIQPPPECWSSVLRISVVGDGCQP